MRYPTILITMVMHASYAFFSSNALSRVRNSGQIQCIKVIGWINIFDSLQHPQQHQEQHVKHPQSSAS